jgi:hypothetical protein
MSAALEMLRARADADVDATAYTGKRRPTWAPPLVLGEELVSTLRELGWLGAEDKPIARLWALFTSPRERYHQATLGLAPGATRCWGFELRAGAARKGELFFVSSRRRDGTWRNGPVHWSYQRGYLLRSRATELGAARVLEFAGAPDEQMRLGGILAGICACCGRALTDPISLERGIGPECWGSAQAEALTRKA